MAQIGILDQGTSNHIFGNYAFSNGTYGIYEGNATTPILGYNVVLSNGVSNSLLPPANTTAYATQTDVFANLGNYKPGAEILCTNCDPSTVAGVPNTCTSSGAQSGAIAEISYSSRYSCH